MKICIKRVPNLMITGVRNEKHFSLEVYDSVSMKILLWFKIFLSPHDNSMLYFMTQFFH